MEELISTLVVERSEYEALQTENAELKLLVEYYKQQFLSSKRRQFGVSSERTDVDCQQLNLFGEDTAAPPPPTEEISYRRKKRVGKREQDLSGLPVET